MDTLRILSSRFYFKAAVEIVAHQEGMLKLFERFGAIRIDTATQYEGSTSFIGMQNAPVELIARSSALFAFCIKEKVFAEITVIVYVLQVLSAGYRECLDKFQP